MLLGTGNSFSFLIVLFNRWYETELWRKKCSFQIFLHKITVCMTKLIFFAVSCGSIHPPRRVLKIPEGRGRRQRPRGKEVIHLVSRGPSIQYAFECRSSCTKVLSYLLSRTFTWKNSGLTISKSTLKAKKMLGTCCCVESAASTCYQSTWSHLVFWSGDYWVSL